MNKIQRKKLYKKIEEEISIHCLHCGKELDLSYEYHSRYHTCDPQCYADMVGVDLY